MSSTSASNQVSVSNTTDVAARVRDARDARETLRIAGSGTWMDAGAPCRATTTLSLRGLSGIVEYEPGDLTLTARAGTPLSDIASATHAHGQWLALDPFGAPHGTLGATVATASYGPLAAAFGTPRNQVLGCELVTGAGEVVRAGGRVVKNVAGFDITRLMVGAWGTLGVLTEVTVRLRARPELDVTTVIALQGHDGIERARRWLRTTEFAPLAAELLSPALSVRLGVGVASTPVLLLRVGGNPALVRAATHAASSLGDGKAVDAGIWRMLGEIDGDIDTTMRMSHAPANIALLWDACLPSTERAGGLMHANLVRGVVRCVLPPGDSAKLTDVHRDALAAVPSATRIIERAPLAVWKNDSGDANIRALSRGVRQVFDPDQLLNPGIMGAE